MSNKHPMQVITTLFFTIMCVGLFGQDTNQREWVESTLQSMSIDEKIGQLFTIRAFSKNDASHIISVKKQIKDYHVGGICFFQGAPEKQVELVNQYQGMSKLPLLISIDAEWGLGMRFPKKAISFPKQLTIGAINDHQLIYLMGKEIGRQCS